MAVLAVLLGLLMPLHAQERLISAGSFMMGDASPGAEGLADERPVHPVQVSPFHVEQFVVSAALWRQVCQWGLTNGYGDLPTGNTGSTTNGDPRHPATGLSWYDAVKWCNARSEMEGLPPVYYPDTTFTTPLRAGQIDLSNACVRWEMAGYRLPTEAEWEYAARGTLAGQDYPWAGTGGSYRDQVDGSQANYRNSGDPLDNGTTPSGYYNGSQQPAGRPGNNQFWLYDMVGNVAQWCWDSYTPADYATLLQGGTANNPRGVDPSASVARAARGGSWDASPFDLRCAFRDPTAPGQRDTRTGLRCVRSNVVTNQALVAIVELGFTNGGPVVRWTTASEPETTGFYLYRLVAGVPVLVGTNLIPATGAAQGGIGATYACADASAPATAVYQLAEVRPDGGTIVHGPFALNMYRFDLASPVPPVSGVRQVRWHSRSNEWYSVWRSTNLAAGFAPLKSWIAPAPPENVFFDTDAGLINVFYQIRSEP
ncbi:MAG: SUMF1/EgtB/PvdO family nonheme iron enzyme [Verrucomicrobiota bacterium]